MARIKRGRFRGLPREDVTVAKAMANVQYGPKMTALDRLVAQAGQEYLADVRSAKAGARATIRGTRRARKPTAKIYRRAAGATRAANAETIGAFGALGAAADPFEAATAREHGAALTRIAEAKAHALNELKQRMQEARSGRALALDQARSTLRSNVADVRGQRQALRGERGQFLVGQLASSVQERREAAEARRLERIRQRGRERLEGQKQRGRTELQKQKDALDELRETSGPGGSKPATRAEQRAFTADFEKALRYARDAVAHNVPRGQAADLLITGKPATREAPAIPAIDDQVALSAALDMVYGQSISPQTARRIRRLGIRPRSLPSAVTPAERRARERRNARATEQQYMTPRY